MCAVAAIRKSDEFSVGKFGHRSSHLDKKGIPGPLHLSTIDHAGIPPARTRRTHALLAVRRQDSTLCASVRAVSRLNAVEGNQWGRPRALVQPVEGATNSIRQQVYIAGTFPSLTRPIPSKLTYSRKGSSPCQKRMQPCSVSGSLLVIHPQAARLLGSMQAHGHI